jgi:hypothetical protein
MLASLDPCLCLLWLGTWTLHPGLSAALLAMLERSCVSLGPPRSVSSSRLTCWTIPIAVWSHP